MKKSDFRLRPLEESDLRLVFDWRNSDRVRMNMFESEPIGWECHLKWFENLQGNPTNKVMMFEFQGESLGVAYGKASSLEKNQWIWGCYLGDKHIFRGAGTIMGILGMEYFFEEIRAGELIAEVLSANCLSDRFHLRIGFKTVSHFTKTTSLGREVPASLLKQTQQKWLEKKAVLLEKYLGES